MIKAIDFFCGAGGLTRGLLDAGINVVAGVDNDLRLRQTYTTNNRPSHFIHRDVHNININALRRYLGINSDDLVLYAACTPCQPFSSLNRMAREDARRDLLTLFGRFVEEAPPDYVLVENVPGLNTAFGRETFQSFRQSLDRAGLIYQHHEFLDAKDFGVPQIRRRFILLASRYHTSLVPKKNETATTVGDVLRKYPEIGDGEKCDQFPNHEARRLKSNHIRIVQAIPKDGGSRRDVLDTSILLKCHQRNPSAHKDVFGRMRWDAPAPTLTCRCTDVYCGRFVHPEQDRGISLREAAALQSFADDYVFFGSFYHIATQIGNAVPVRFGKGLGETIVNAAQSQSLNS